MEFLALPAVTEIINQILSQGPEAIEQFKRVLALIAAGAHTIAAVSALIAQYPAISEAAAQLLVILNGGGSIIEIATALAQFATSGGVAIDAIIQLLQIILSIIVCGSPIGI